MTSLRFDSFASACALACFGLQGCAGDDLGLRHAEAAEMLSEGQTLPGYPRLEPAQIGAVTRVATGYALAESPVWDHCTKTLFFTDVDRSIIHQMGADGKIGRLATNTNHTNGIALHHDGSMILAQMGGGRGGRIVRRAPDGTTHVLVDKDPRGGRLHTVDDVAIRADGTIYFTDGDFSHGDYSKLNLGALPLYVLRPGVGMVQLVRGPAVSGPNGVELSPDEKTLYLASYFGDQILKYAVADDGTLTPQGALATRINKMDSFCLDAAGNLYAGMEDGLLVLRPDGSRVKLIAIRSADGTTNCTFGGEHGTTLYVTSHESLWKIERMPIPGSDWIKHRARIPCDDSAGEARLGHAGLERRL